MAPIKTLSAMALVGAAMAAPEDACTYPGGQCYELRAQKCQQGSTTDTMTIHGLWPEWTNGCDGADFDISLLAPIKDQMDKIWLSCPEDGGDNEKFWSHEWQKHGTCTGMDQLSYFKKGLDLFQKNEQQCPDGSDCSICFDKALDSTMKCDLKEKANVAVLRLDSRFWVKFYCFFCALVATVIILGHAPWEKDPADVGHYVDVKAAYCDEFTCPKNGKGGTLGWLKKPMAATIPCGGDPCIEVCCDKIGLCSTLTCPLGYYPKKGSERIPCEGGGIKPCSQTEDLARCCSPVVYERMASIYKKRKDFAKAISVIVLADEEKYEKTAYLDPVKAEEHREKGNDFFKAQYDEGSRLAEIFTGRTS